MNKIYQAILVFTGLVLSVLSATAQLTVNNLLTPNQLVQQVLLGSGVQAFNVTYTGYDSAIGSFNGTASNIGMAGGVILCTGKTSLAPGPNNAPNAGYNNLFAGDAQLDTISNGITHNAAILEFDFIPIGDTVKFRYVFASEEYPEYVNLGVNDAFAFFISGPSIVGSHNIATLPNAWNTPVSIDSVNASTNSSYYIDNAGGLTVQYDGFTIPMIAISHVIPCDTFHIKIAIADGGDGIFDSGVFLEQGSFSGGNAFVSTYTNVLDTALGDTLVRGCNNGYVIISIPQILANDTTIHFLIGGSAVNGHDYTWIPDSVTIPAGQLHDTLVISPTNDTIDYTTKFIIIGITFATGCNTYALDSVILPIKNVGRLTAFVGNDTTICWGQQAMITTRDTGGFGTYTFTWDNNAGNNDTAIVSPTSSTVYHITTTDACGHSSYDSVKVNLVFAPHALAPDSVTIEGCSTGYVLFSIPNTRSNPYVIHYTLGGTGTNGTDFNHILDSVIIPAGQLTDTLWITAIQDTLNEPNETITITFPLPFPCSGIDSTTVTIINVNPIALTVNNDTTICYPNSAVLNASSTGGHGNYTYTWDHGLGSNPSQIVAPDSTTTYTVIVLDSCGNSKTKSITVNVQIPDSLALIDFPAAATCHDGKIIFTLPFAQSHNTTITYTIGGSATNGNDYSHLSGTIIIPAGQTVDTIAINALVDLVDTATYKTLTITIQQPAACGNTISVTIPIINVLPMTLSLTPDSVLCLGQAIDLKASVKGGYIGYNYVWNNGLGNASSHNVNPNGTTTYTVAVNDSCGHHILDSTNVRIIPHPKTSLTISPLDSMCTYDNAVITFHDTLVGNGVTNINFDGATAQSGSGYGPYTVQWANPGIYTITYLAVAERGCFRDSSHYDLYVKNCAVTIPNVFTPNADGKNDFFTILNMDEFPNSRLVVFNRWGEHVYDSPNYHNEWDGANVPDGTYFYILYLVDGHIYHGYLTVIGKK